MDRLVWARNPDNYIKECLEVGHNRFVFDIGRVVKRGMDVNIFMDLYMGSYEWEALLVTREGALHLDNDHTRVNPLGVYPVWEFGMDLRILENFMANPVGENLKLCNSSSTHVEERPVYGQPHIVVLQNLPYANDRTNLKFYQLIAWMQEEYPDCILHIHGLYSCRVMYGMNFRSVDFDPRNDAGLGTVMLPTGSKKKVEKLAIYKHWIELLDFRITDMKVPRNRCMYNIKSHVWMGQYFTESIKFQTNKNAPVDIDDGSPPTNHRIFFSNKKAQEGDKYLCDLCSLQDSCKFYRTGAVCIVPGSDAVQLAKLLNTRDSESIIHGLGLLLEVESKRLGKALEKEVDDDDVNPEVTKMIHGLYDRGVKLAKLINPALSGPKTTVTVNTQTNSITASTPQALMAGIMEEFLKRGFTREEVTPDMVKAVLQSPADLRDRAIEAAAVEHASD